jgi:hypothetical protein
MASKSSSSLVFAVLALFLAFVLKEVYRKNWFYAPALSKDTFQSTDFTVMDIPTTYYHVGQLDKVLNGWYESPNGPLSGYFQLFRVHPDSKPYVFDISTITAKTQAEKFLESCDYPESIICKVCLNSKGPDAHHVLNVSEIFEKPGNFYSSFAKMDDIPSVKNLLYSIQIPNMNYEKMNFEHAFIGNFDRDRMTAYLHGNTITSSMAIQFVGSKTWLFFAPEEFKGKSMLDSFPAAGISVPSKGPDGHFRVYRYVSQPGDVLFFSENWGHTVLTHAGPNIMMNFRRLEFGNFLRHPLDWIIAAVNGALYKNQGKNGRQRTPFNELQDVYMRKMDALCGDGKLAPWDAAMVQLIKNGK